MNRGLRIVAGFCAVLGSGPLAAMTPDEAAENVALTILATWDCAVSANDLAEVKAELGLGDADFDAALRDLIATNRLSVEGNVYQLIDEECV